MDTLRLIAMLSLATAHGLPAQNAGDAAPAGTAARTGNARADTLRLGALQRDAERTDRRAGQIELLAQQSALRLHSIRAERLPSIGLLGQAQYLSDVPTVGSLLPAGAAPPPPPNDNYDSHVSARQRLFDPTVVPRREVERAQVAESQARVRSALFAQRQAVSEAFFAALLLDEQRKTLEAALSDLEAQRVLAGERVDAGAALPSEVHMLDAELLRRRQTRDGLLAERDAARDVLGTLTGRVIAADVVLEVPQGAGGADSERVREAAARRPEYATFDRGRELLIERRAAVEAQVQPRVSAFARAGYGRPGLNPLAREFDSYWLAGVQLEWTPWDWGNTRREREVLHLQSQLLDTDEAAFTANVERAVIRALASITQLERTIASDSAIIALQDEVLREARVRFAEGVITAAEYVDRQTDLLSAQLANSARVVQLAEARARLLTTLGLEVP